MEKWICKCCEAENSDDANYCVICGTKREDPHEASDPQPQAAPPMKEVIVYCDENGNQVDSPQKAASFRIFGTDEAGNRYERWGYISPAGPAADPAVRKRPDRTDAGAFVRKDFPSETTAPVSGDALRDSIRKADSKKLIFRILIVLFVVAEYILFLQPYSRVIKRNTYGLYAIWYNAIGENGAIEQICSIVLVVISVLPAILCWIDFKLRSKNLPVTIGAFVSGLTTIYCCVIWFGSDKPTVVPAFIILSSWLVFVCTVLLVRACVRQKEAVYRPKGF